MNILNDLEKIRKTERIKSEEALSTELVDGVKLTMRKLLFIVLITSLTSCGYSEYKNEEYRLDLKLKELEVLEKYYSVSNSIQAEKDLKQLIEEQEKTVADFDSLFPKTK